MAELERRDYFRMEDQVHLTPTLLDAAQVSDNPYSDQYHLPRQVQLIGQLQAIDNESRDLLRQVGDYNRALSSYLKALEEKIELLANFVLNREQEVRKETVILSEGGIAFFSGIPYAPGAHLHLLIMLFPGYSTLATIGVVRTCEQLPDQRYQIGVEFTVLLEQDRKLLARHLRRRESQAIREQAQKSRPNK